MSDYDPRKIEMITMWEWQVAPTKGVPVFIMNVYKCFIIKEEYEKALKYRGNYEVPVWHKGFEFREGVRMDHILDHEPNKEEKEKLLITGAEMWFSDHEEDLQARANLITSERRKLRNLRKRFNECQSIRKNINEIESWKKGKEAKKEDK